MNTYYIAFNGVFIVDADSEDEAISIFYDSTGDLEADIINSFSEDD